MIPYVNSILYASQEKKTRYVPLSITERFLFVYINVMIAVRFSRRENMSKKSANIHILLCIPCSYKQGKVNNVRFINPATTINLQEVGREKYFTKPCKQCGRLTLHSHETGKCIRHLKSR
jgi:predicted nucleic-acid-binding Zn-ribbon protein